MTAQILFLAIGLIFLVIGMNMLSNARKEGKSLTNAYIVMGVGVVLGLGLGAGMFLENVGKNLNNF
jgi:multisubunit Na+/H+ antiporter MnhB subunit